MLDTNAVRALVDGDSPRLACWLADQRCCIWVTVAAEIRFGLERQPQSSPWRTLVARAQEGGNQPGSDRTGCRPSATRCSGGVPARSEGR